jgi:hypothetical protein
VSAAFLANFDDFATIATSYYDAGELQKPSTM